VAVAERTDVRHFERWLSIAGSAVAAYALYRALGPVYRNGFTPFQGRRHRGGKGTGFIADRGSNTRRQLGGRHGTHVEESVSINRPAVELYRFWRDFENLPKFMKHLEAVAIHDGGVSHWTAKGPGGMHVEWDARVINDVDGRLIAWQSLNGSRIATAGSVNFEETDRGTEVKVHLQYRPPAGKLGSAVAYVFGEEPSLQIREDLRRFKQLMETGEIPTTEGQPSGRRA
jgi:uncharacterized membrane protein